MNEKPKVGRWYLAKSYPERGPGQLKEVSTGVPILLVYHPNWNHGHNGGKFAKLSRNTGDHCWWYAKSGLIETSAPKKEE